MNTKERDATIPHDCVCEVCGKTIEPLVRWLDGEILDDEGAMISAREDEDWGRLRILEGHKMALLAVKQKLQGKISNECPRCYCK